MNLIALLRKAARPFFEKAELARHNAANRLAAIGEVLLSGVNYYQQHSSNTSSAPGVFVTSDAYNAATSQHTTADPDLTTLAKNLLTYQSQLNMGSSDTESMTKDLTSLGVTAADAGTIIGDIQNYKTAEGALPRVGGLANFLGAVLPIIAEIGMGAAAA